MLRAARASQTATDLRVGGAIIMASVQSRRGLTGPSGARSEVTVVETKSGRILLVLSPRTEETTKIVEVDHTSGVLLPQPKDMVQEFKAHNEALEYQKKVNVFGILYYQPFFGKKSIIFWSKLFPLFVKKGR